jgi:hypothetical protein
VPRVWPGIAADTLDSMAHDRSLRRAAVSALKLAFPLGIFSTLGYAIVVRGEGLLEDLTLRDNLTVVGVVVGLWLVLWPLFAAAQRRSDRADVLDRGPIELPPRDPAEMTGQELADWAGGDPDKLRRLLRRVERRRRDSGLEHGPVVTAPADDEISVRNYLRQLRRWIAPGLLVAVLGIWALTETEGMSLAWALGLWGLLAVALGPMLWLRHDVRHTAPGWRRALGLAALWAIAVFLMLGIVYGLAMAMLAS